MSKKDKRKLKPSSKRQKAQSVSLVDVVAEVGRRTGFKECDIKDVLNAFGIVTREYLISGECVRIPKLGLMSPDLHPPKYSALKKHMQEKAGIENPDGITKGSYTLKFRTNDVVEDGLRKLEVTKEAIDALYINEKSK